MMFGQIGLGGGRPQTSGGGASAEEVVASPAFVSALEEAIEAKTSWRGARRRANTSQPTAVGENLVLLQDLTLASPDFSAVQNAANGIVIPDGVSFIRAHFGCRFTASPSQRCYFWAFVRQGGPSGPIVSNYCGISSVMGNSVNIASVSSKIAVQPGDVVFMGGSTTTAATLVVSSGHDNAAWLEVEVVS